MDKPVTLAERPHSNEKDYSRIFVYCKNCGSRHHQYILRGNPVTKVPCTKCDVRAVELSKKSYDEWCVEQDKIKAQRNRSSTTLGW